MFVAVLVVTLMANMNARTAAPETLHRRGDRRFVLIGVVLALAVLGLTGYLSA